MPARMRAVGRRLVVAAGVTAIALPGIAPATAQSADPSVVGAMSGLFEEGGDAQPTCAPTDDGFVTCKPTAVSLAVLGDGDILYWNGIENSEQNIRLNAYVEAGNFLRDSRARVLELDGDAPNFVDVGRGIAGDNPAGYAGETPVLEDPLGFVGIGRPGDGFTGSTLGQLFPTNPVAPPDDPVDNDADMFCSDLAHLADGSILVAGGSDFYNSPAVPYDVPGIGGMGQPEIEGLRTAQVFDPETREWSQVDDMKYGRWYPTLTTLPDGDVHVVSGVTRLIVDTQLSQVRRSETFDLQTRTWSENYVSPASENSLPLYPRMHLTPNGKVFYAASGQLNGFGPTGYGADEALWGLYQFFNPESSEWEVAGATQWAGLVRGGAFSTPLMMEAPYDSMDIVVGGGTLGPTPSSILATGLSEVLTVGADDSVSTRTTGELNNPRWFSSGVLLPDGQVLAANGANLDHVVATGFETPVRELELFDPETDTWTAVASTQRDRGYHNMAVLLPDARVLIGGNSPIPLGTIMSHQDLGAPFGNNEKDASFEIYSPPYLFRGERPVIAQAPDTVQWGSTFRVATPQAEQIESVSLIRVPDASHSVDADQRGLELPFTATNGNLTVEAPPNGIAAPPGPYYLFVNRGTDEGPVPSKAAIVTVGDAGTGGAAVQPSYDSDAVADAGSARPTDDSNIIAGLLSRNYPSPGFVQVVDEVLGGQLPAEAYTTPADLIDVLAAEMGQDITAEQLANEMWAAGMQLFGPGTDGLIELQRVVTQVLGQAGPGVIDVPIESTGMFPDPPGDGQAAPQQDSADASSMHLDSTLGTDGAPAVDDGPASPVTVDSPSPDPTGLALADSARGDASAAGLTGSPRGTAPSQQRLVLGLLALSLVAVTSRGAVQALRTARRT